MPERMVPLRSNEPGYQLIRVGLWVSSYWKEDFPPLCSRKYCLEYTTIFYYCLVIEIWRTYLPTWAFDDFFFLPRHFPFLFQKSRFFFTFYSLPSSVYMIIILIFWTIMFRISLLLIWNCFSLCHSELFIYMYGTWFPVITPWMHLFILILLFLSFLISLPPYMVVPFVHKFPFRVFIYIFPPVFGYSFFFFYFHNTVQVASDWLSQMGL